VLGPLADFVRTSRRDAELAERLLGEWLHAVLVRDASVIDDIRRWHSAAQPGPLLLLPCVPVRASRRPSPQGRAPRRWSGGGVGARAAGGSRGVGRRIRAAPRQRRGAPRRGNLRRPAAAPCRVGGAAARCGGG
jgi:hypothetical protein